MYIVYCPLNTPYPAKHQYFFTQMDISFQHVNYLVRLSSEKYPASSSIPTANFSIFFKEIERTTLICDYF